jgi:heme A synthase
MKPEPTWAISIIAAIVLVITAIWLTVKSEILKDQSTATNKPYSYSRFQMLWWTVIILGVFILAYGFTGNILSLNDSCLILIGISTGTIASGKIIDNTQIANVDGMRSQNMESEGFLIDLLSDENGVSVHRFQAFVFNLVFGIIFIVKFFESLKTGTAQYYLFSQNELILMGISSATYIGIKMTENSKPALMEDNSDTISDTDDITPKG